MIVHRFLTFLKTASVSERAAGARALVRAYQVSDLEAEERAAAEAAMTILLDDAAPAVRLALAEAVAGAAAVPRHVILALADDQPDIAGVVLRHSPLFVDGELVDRVAKSEVRVQRAIAERRPLSLGVAAAVAEVASAEACSALLDNDAAELPVFSLSRIVERHGKDPVIREKVLARPDLPTAIRHRLATELGQVLAAFVVEREWLAAGRAQDVSRDAVERVTLDLADTTDPAAIADLVGHLVETGQLTAILILRALCAGQVLFLEEALVHLTGFSRQRVASLVHGGSASAFQALYRKAGLPDQAYPAFQAALDIVLETEVPDRIGARAHYARQVLERVLTRYRAFSPSESDQLLVLLRRFAAEAAREEARLYAASIVETAPRLLAAPRAA